MRVKQLALASQSTARRAAGGFARLAKLERVLALGCILMPAILMLFDDLPVRSSISDYYKMRWDQMYYFPLSAISILFVVNGIVKERHVYNTILGVMLGGVILFDCDHFSKLHVLFASGFFVGNGAVVLLYSSLKHYSFKAVMAATIIAALLACFALHLITLFWLEWVSLAIIAVHYFIESSYDVEAPRRLPGPIRQASAAG